MGIYITSDFISNKRPPVGGVDRSGEVDRISLPNAVETPFWMAVYAAEPNRMVDVRMSYEDLKIICDMIDKARDKDDRVRRIQDQVQDIVSTVDNWPKDNPKKTNGDAFKEVFGPIKANDLWEILIGKEEDNVTATLVVCFSKWWGEEYKKPGRALKL